MASVYRVTANWSNFLGAPGITKLSFIAATGDAGAVAATAAARAFFNGFAPTLPAGLQIQVSREVQEYDEATGTLLGEVVASVTPALVTGASAPAYAGGAGAFIGWKTGAIWQGRRVQGRTFMVPMAGIFEANGTPTSAYIASAQSVADALIADAGTTFAVWAKKFDKTQDPPVQTNGAAFQVLSSVVRDVASGLRTRRS